MSDGTRTASLMECLDRIEEMVSAARRVPLTGNVVVNETELLELLDHVRLELPDTVKEADELLGRRDEVLAAAGRRADELMGEAREAAAATETDARRRADALVEQHAVTREAEARAAETMAQAEARSAAVRAEAETYVRGVMEQLEEHLSRTIGTVRRGLETLLPENAPRRRGHG